MDEDMIKGILFLVCLLGWILTLFFFILKKKELSNLKIGLFFTLAYRIIKISIFFYDVDATAFLLYILLSFDWIIMPPIIMLVSFLIRKIKFRREIVDSIDNNL